MSLDLSPEIENVVRERAAAEGLSVNDLLTRIFAPDSGEMEPISDPKAHVRALLAKWQAEDKTPKLPLVPVRPGETPSQALFRKWEEEDALLTEEERQTSDRLWEGYQQGIDEERASAGMRTLF